MMCASRASTATLGREETSLLHSQRSTDRPKNNPEMLYSEQVEPEKVPESLRQNPDSEVTPKRLILAIDFGTTYSAVSYAILEEGESKGHLRLNRIQSIKNFPDLSSFGVWGDRMEAEVPTEVIYPLDRGFRKKEKLAAIEQEEVQDESDANSDGLEELGSFAGTDPDEDIAMHDADWERMANIQPAKFRWGYGVHEAWALQATHADAMTRPLSRFKLLLDSSPSTKDVREKLNEVLGELKIQKIVKNPLDVIVDFLTCLMRHTKMQLRQFDDSYRREIVMCVPAIWSQKASRDMQRAMTMAMKQARFEGVNSEDNCIENLFIVSEPEAAAAYVLAAGPHVSPGETFVLLDAGGGTVDANTYTVSTTTPLRLTKEVVAPGGGLCGSSYLNEGFRKLLHDLLDSETYLNDEEPKKNRIEGYIEKIMINEFEYRIKRSFNYLKATGFKAFDIPGLKDNREKRFRNGQMYIPMESIRNIFLKKCLDPIGAIMEEQIDSAKNHARVEKVILIGGFASSPSLQKYLEQRLRQFCRQNSIHDIELIKPDKPKSDYNAATAVASGAVLRAFNKEQGPRRIARASYGILRSEPWMDFTEHLGQPTSLDKHDGQLYVKNTIDWVLKLGTEVDPVWICEPFLVTHTFNYWPPASLKVKELIYVSDKATESHYHRRHQKNAGLEKIGSITVDFSDLRDQGLIQPIEKFVDEDGNRIGRKHYKVNYTMVIKVVDRDLQCFAVLNGNIRKRCQINIASAFSPGAN